MPFTFTDSFSGSSLGAGWNDIGAPPPAAVSGGFVTVPFYFESVEQYGGSSLDLTVALEAGSTGDTFQVGIASGVTPADYTNYVFVELFGDKLRIRTATGTILGSTLSLTQGSAYVLTLSIDTVNATATIAPAAGGVIDTVTLALDAGAIAMMAALGTLFLYAGGVSTPPFRVDEFTAVADASTAAPPAPPAPGAVTASYEVRITPLLKGVPTKLETDAGGITTIADESATTLVPQFLDDNFGVNIAISEPGTGTVVIPIDEPCVADLEPFAQAVRVSYLRPGESVPEALLYGPCNVSTDYAAGTVTLTIQDPSQRCQHHYIRRGDYALNQTNETGFIKSNSDSIFFLIDAARNTDEQQNRNVPALAFDVWEYGSAVDGAPFIEVQRGQEVWDACQQILRSDTGPDCYLAPVNAWTYPFRSYAELGMYDAITDPAAPGAGELGRNLDPADPNAPVAGEVIFDYGLGLDNLIGLTEEPSHATTHVHVVDADRKYRVTAADAASSAEIGVWVDWVATDYNVVGGDTAPLEALARARVNAYGRPPKFFTCTLRPDDAQSYHYGHKFWSAGTPGDFQIGDFVRVRAARGYRSFSTLARVTSVRFRIESGLVTLDVGMVPAVAGGAGEDPQGN